VLTIPPGRQVPLSGARWVQPTSPALGQAEGATSELEGAVSDIAEQLLALSDRLQTDADLALNPDRFQEIEIIGGVGQPRIFETIGGVAGNLSDIILGVLTPPLGAYVTPATTAVLSEADTRLKAISQAMVEAQGAVNLTSVVLPEVQAYREFYLDTVSDVIIAVEKLVVVEENGNIDVYEPDEKNGMNLFAVAGIAAAVALMVAVS
jgi:hypothetical protein